MRIYIEQPSRKNLVIFQLLEDDVYEDHIKVYSKDTIFDAVITHSMARSRGIKTGEFFFPTRRVMATK